jgi:glycosyltransferase involved in cell wall biosynthesis
MRGPEGVKTHFAGVRFDDPNDVGPAQLLRYEIEQRSIVRRLLKTQRFDAVHRITPSGYKDSLLPVTAVPLVVGPVLGSDAPPPSFDPIFRRRLSPSLSAKSIVARIGNGIARRVFQRSSTLQQLLENAAIVLVGTEVTRRRLPERLKARSRLITYAGVEHDQFTPPSTRRPSRLAQLLFVGRVVPYKGVELLLRAAALACQRCPFELKIVGNGFPPYECYCRELVAGLNLTDVVSFIGAVPREALVELYCAADIFCMPSIETYGVAILEAMSSGCAVVVADANGPGEIVKAGTGVKVPLESPQQFVNEYAERLVQLVGDADLRRELGGAAREHVVRFHDWTHIASALVDLYTEAFTMAGPSAAALPTQSTHHRL